MEKITSISNNLVKETVKLQQKKFRETSGKFLLEGAKPVLEAFNCGLQVDYLFVREDKSADYEFLKDKLILTNEAVLKKISTTDSAPDCVGVASQKKFSLQDVENCQRVLLLENIKDAGNLGTILRTSAALGVDLVVLWGDCVDLYNPKVVRSAVGCLWKLPIVKMDNRETFLEIFKNHTKISTLPRSKNLLKTFTQTPPFVVMFGSEADGLSEDLINICDTDLKIEMRKNVESLNLSVSCAIVLYKLLI